MGIHTSDSQRALLGAAAVLFLSAAGVSQGILMQTTFHDLGVNPVRMDLADLDGDGLVDVVVANRISSDVTVLFGKLQPPYFELPVSIITGPLPLDVLLRDVTGNGRPEILTLNTGSGTVSIHEVFPGRDIRFLRSLDVSPDPSVLHVVDLDFRGILDIAVLSTSGGKVTFLRGIGNGNFQPPAVLQVGDSPTQLAFADFDGDGLRDMAVSQQFSDLKVFLSEGNLSFLEPAAYGVPGGSLELQARDISEDGIPDLVVMSRGAGKVTVLLGLGQGNFQVLPFVVAGITLRDMVITDVTLDGLPDVIVAASGGNAVSILPGLGDGVLGAPLSLPVGNYPFEVAVADISFDGIPDIACANLLDNTITIYEGRGGLSFGSTPTVLPVGRRPVLMQSRDLNGDGPPELVVAHYASDDLGLLINERRLRQIMAGNVNQGAGAVTDVLFVNGQVGDVRREVRVPLNQSMTVRMEGPPAGPVPAGFVLYALASAPGVNGVTAQPGGLGNFAFSTPLTGGGSRLIVLVNNLGHFPSLGRQTIDREIPLAPVTVVRRAQGFSRPALVTLQAFIADFGSRSGHPISITNAIVLILGDPLQ